MPSESADFELREATHDDYDAVEAFTRNTWPDRDGGDYIPRIYHDWIEGDDRRTVVAEVVDAGAGTGEIAGIAQGVALSEWEAWGQGMRVNPAFRGEGISVSMTHDLFDWARKRGASVFRNMVFSWNVGGLGSARASGFDPATEFRWAHPDPDPDADPADSGLSVTDDPNAAWRFWTDSDARHHLRGLALDAGESWAVSTLTRENLRTAADDGGLFVVQGDGTKGFAHRIREYDRETGDDDETGDGDGGADAENESSGGGESKGGGQSSNAAKWIEYGVAAWADARSARAVMDAIARDAAESGADETRVLIPETARHVSDVALSRTQLADEPDFVLAADLTR